MAERARQKAYWDSNLDAANLGGGISDSPESLVEELIFSSVPDIENMIAYVEPGPQKVLLEIGSGLGANAVLLSAQGANVVALDLSHERLAALRSRTSHLPNTKGGRIYPVKAKAEALPFKATSIDGACSRAVLIHTDLPAACDEVVRVLKPGAPAAFSEPMAHNPLVRVYRGTFAPSEWKEITTYFSAPQIELVKGKFSDSSDRRYYGLSFAAFAFQYAVKSPRWFYPALHHLMKMDKFVSGIWSGSRKFAWFVLITGRKK